MQQYPPLAHSGNALGAAPYHSGPACSQCADGDTCHERLCVSQGEDSKLAPGHTIVVVREWVGEREIERQTETQGEGGCYQQRGVLCCAILLAHVKGTLMPDKSYQNNTRSVLGTQNLDNSIIYMYFPAGFCFDPMFKRRESRSTKAGM